MTTTATPAFKKKPKGTEMGTKIGSDEYLPQEKNHNKFRQGRPDNNMEDLHRHEHFGRGKKHLV